MNSNDTLQQKLKRAMAADPKGAVLDPRRVRRYVLWRVFDPARPLVSFIGLNPSTADENKDDHTIRRCLHFATDWGYGGILMVNLFAWRTAYPSGLLTPGDPVGPANDDWLRAVDGMSAATVCCWGDLSKILHTSFENRAAMVRANIQSPFVLGVTKSGYPRHPSRAPKISELRAWS